VCKYAGNPLTDGKTIIYKYTSNRREAERAQSVSPAVSPTID
jgi:hypothetical protein